MQSNINYVPAEELTSPDILVHTADDEQLASAGFEIIKAED